MVRKLVVLFSFLVAVVCLAGDAALSKEHRLSPDPPSVAAPFTQHDVASAVGPDGQFLVVWVDSREDLAGDFSRYNALVAARVTPAGEILDPEGIVLDATGGAPPSVAWNGRDYLVVTTFRAYLVAPDGTFRRANLNPGFATLVAAGGNGREGVIATTRGLFFLDENGASTQSVSVGGNSNGVVKGVVPQGDDWILIFNQFADRYDWYRVNRSGVVLSRTFFAGPGSVSPTQIAGNGSGTMLVYVAGALFANFDREVSVKALFLNKDGFPASDWTIGKVTLKSTVDLAATRPSVTWDGQSFVVVWRDLSAGFENSLRVTRIDPDVFQLPPSVAVDGAIPNDSKSSKPTVSGSSKGLLVAWEIDAAKSTTETDILVHVAPAVETMRVSLSQLVSSAPVNEQNVRGAVDRNGGMFTVWRERGTVGRIGGALTRPDGTQSPRRAISANVVSAEFPVVAWNDGVYLVAWREDDPPSGSSRDTFAVMGRRYNERGEALDAAPFPIAVQLIDPRPDPLARHIAIASNGKNFLVAWIVLGQDVHAARVRTDGTVLDPFPIEIATASSLAYEPGILVDGDTYVVWWSELQDALTRVTGAAVSNGGTVVENPHAYFVRTLPDGLRTSTFRTIPFHVASNGTEALTTWKRLGASNNATCIYATRTNLQGLPAFSPEKQVACFTTQFSTMNEPRAVWDGKQWWVVYYTPVTLELVAVPLDSNINPAGPAMVITPATDQTEALALTTPHGAAILYNRIDPASHYVRRAFARNIVINARSRAAEH